MRFTVEPSPSGGYFVRAAGVPAPVSRHDTEDEAEAAAAAYDRGISQERRAGTRVELRDGSEVLIRPVRSEDKPLFAAAWDRFGEQSRYRRFMSPKPRLTVDELAFFTELDHVDHEALGALDPRTGEGLGVARYVRRPERPGTAEAAVSVIDPAQGRGLGTALLHHLARHAIDNGIRCFTASMLAANESVLHMLEKLGTVTVTGRHGPEIELDVELAVTDSSTLELALRSAATGHLKRRDGAP